MSNQQKTWVDEFEGYISSAVGVVKSNVQQPICDALNQIPFQQWKNTYYSPLNQEYRKWPQQFAEFKQKSILSCGNENQRMILLGLSTLAIVSLTGRSSGVLSIVRSSVVTYYGLGLVIAPEIYNPLLVNKSQEK